MPSVEMQRGIEAFVARLRQIPQAVDERREQATPSVAALGSDIHVEPVVARSVPGEWVWAEGADTERIVLCLHHGGYVAGTAADLRPFEASLSRLTGVRFLAIDYRLAPEHRFPAQIEDVLAAYQWLLDSGKDPTNIAFGGASAGAGLAISALAAVRDAGLPMPAAGFAVSPWTDMTLTSSSMVAEESDDPLGGLDQVKALVETVLGGQDPRWSLPSPLFAELKGLPPVHVEVGTAERLLDDSRNFVAAASEAGVEVTLVETEGAIHCFPLHIPDTPESEAAIDRIARHLTRWMPACGCPATGSPPAPSR